MQWEEKKQNFINAYNANNFDGTGVSVIDMATYLGVSKNTVINHAERFNKEFELNEDRTIVKKKEEIR